MSINPPPVAAIYYRRFIRVVNLFFLYGVSDTASTLGVEVFVIVLLELLIATERTLRCNMILIS